MVFTQIYLVMKVGSDLSDPSYSVGVNSIAKQLSPFVVDQSCNLIHDRFTILLSGQLSVVSCVDQPRLRSTLRMDSISLPPKT